MKLKLVRYGGLSSVCQDGYDPAMPTFHAPPARRGIYAFVASAVTRFLIYKEEFDSRRMEWVRDEEGNRIPHDAPLAAALCRGEHLSRPMVCAGRAGVYLARHKRPKVFTHDGVLWHHLPVARAEVIKEKGCWVLTATQAHKKAFSKALHQKIYAQERGQPSRLLDDFEVFIEKV
jgi:hypothetical protein